MPIPTRALRNARSVALSVSFAVFAFASCTPGAGEEAASRPPAAGSALPPLPPPSAAPAASSAPGVTSAESADAAFSRLAAKFLAKYLELLPHEATSAGEHGHDGKWPDWSAEGDAAEKRFVEATRAELAAIDKGALGAQNRVDYGTLENRLGLWVFSLEDLRERETNPVAYTGLLGEALDPMLARDFAPLEERMKSLKERLAGLPAVVAVAKKRLTTPPKVHTETAIQQNKGLIELCKSGLTEHVAKVPAQKAEIEAAAKKAQAALEDFQVFLEKVLLPRSTGDFRLGKARFEKKLGYYLDDAISPADLAKGARALLVETQESMAQTALEIWPTVMKGAAPKATTAAEKKALVKQVLAKLAEDRSTNVTIVADAQRTLAEATKFVRDNDIVRVPDEPCKIIEMPEHRRGVAIAYCDSSGPLEKKQETFYAISPTPKDWPAKRAESFYREYNKSMLANLTVHEAMPGHFLQAMHANKFHSDIRAVFSNGAFVEGWAVYGEWVLAKRGFGGPKVRIQRQKMTLRLAANAILDHEIHAGAMDEKAALALMMDEAFQEEGEAVGKWKRARLTSAQLTTYYYGLTEMLKLRAAAEKMPDFRERTYHDKLLGFGAPSFRYLRTLMGPGGARE